MRRININFSTSSAEMDWWQLLQLLACKPFCQVTNCSTTAQAAVRVVPHNCFGANIGSCANQLLYVSVGSCLAHVNIGPTSVCEDRLLTVSCRCCLFENKFNSSWQSCAVGSVQWPESKVLPNLQHWRLWHPGECTCSHWHSHT